MNIRRHDAERTAVGEGAGADRQALRTPDVGFERLPGFNFRSRFSERLGGYPGLRMHWIDEGSTSDMPVFLCLHGQPTWSYLYRRMFPYFVKAGCRVVAPDYFGFGRSDKPVAEATYSFEFHRNSLIALIEILDLRRITLVCQDWGGLLGLTIPMDMPERFERLLIMNTALGTGDEPLTEGFLKWREWSNANPDMAVGKLLRRACPHLSDAEAAAYDAPFPDARFKAGVRRFPNLVPDRPDAPGAELSRRARTWWQRDWHGRSFMAIGAADPVLGTEVMMRLRDVIRGCPPPLVVEEGGHFVQEWGERVSAAALEALA
jgi:pimeloyl-ACP methyl ester carboxylesterase